jgi:hypothetical protein
MTTETVTLSSHPSHRRIPCLVMSRIVGYISVVQDWHDGKRQEFADRVPFRVAEEISVPGDDPRERKRP